ncbi:hypothetical protein BJV82DRAFT_619592 [Fennellomyces sp. T-0311]|nr:hypothetical protein BJV82DRAFT_619592 [Fennellomyces sp. T-0311]
MDSKSQYGYDGLIGFVLGNALNEVCSLPTSNDKVDDDDVPVGVRALHDDKGEAAPPLAKNGNISDDLDESATMSPLEFLISSTPTHTYSGTFNPFTHQILRSTGTLFETPMRKCSRFGFAQI